MIEKELQTITESGIQVIGKLLGNEMSKKLIVCSHGFGVKSDDSGLFNIICETYKEKYLTVRFHYVAIDDFTSSTYVYEFSKQIEKLHTVISKIKAQYQIDEVIIIAHSQGCLVASLYLEKHTTEISKLILLAPPPSTDLVKKMTSYWADREGSVLDFTGQTVFARADGSKTYIPSAFWKEAMEVKPADLFNRIMQKYDTYFIRASNDLVIPPEENQNLININPKNYSELPTGHDFKEDHRLGLLGILNQLLS